MKNLLCILSLCWYTSTILSQTNYETGILPKVNLGVKLDPVYTLNVEIAPRVEVSEGIFDANNPNTIYFSLLDVTTVVSRVVWVDAKIGLGYLSRFQNNKIIHRFLQQYTVTNPYFGYRLGHRFRVDETVRNNEKTEFRVRYRLSSDISMNGEFIDPQEVYFKIGNEYVYSFQGKETDFEIRLVPSLGYYVNDDHKLEIGVDYRVNSFLSSTANHRFWLHLGYFISL